MRSERIERASSIVGRGNPKLIVDCARASKNSNECKAHILNDRFLNMEAERHTVSPTHDGFLPDSELQPNSPEASRILDQPQNEKPEPKEKRHTGSTKSSVQSSPPQRQASREVNRKAGGRMEVRRTTTRQIVHYDAPQTPSPKTSQKGVVSITLPQWIDHLILEDLGTYYSPSGSMRAFDRNLHSTTTEIKTYLGTYFPRSFAEAFVIFDSGYAFAPIDKRMIHSQAKRITSNLLCKGRIRVNSI